MKPILMMQVTVTKKDGSRGHHVNDYIPDDEMAKFMSKVRHAPLLLRLQGLPAPKRLAIGQPLVWPGRLPRASVPVPIVLGD